MMSPLDHDQNIGNLQFRGETPFRDPLMGSISNELADKGFLVTSTG
ncbi:hypothetical protein GGE67_002708 [Rhizobium leucaenae]|uniref:Uncharacterized protein n=1 Tax=Rhizobium leucaenae TaxID=29450 RepID=A0A7W6ZUF3_9HYPH|nr:hypothetical protein [Rhizobium leucaenae]MBB6302089.1 hypothetical protein [Rhizobium leucaenae]